MKDRFKSLYCYGRLYIVRVCGCEAIKACEVLFFLEQSKSLMPYFIHNVEYDEQKHRIIYECKSALPDFEYSPGKMSMADEQRLLELAAFTNEYFGDIQDLEKAVQTIAGGISNDNLYQWNLDNNICAMAQAIHYL